MDRRRIALLAVCLAVLLAAGGIVLARSGGEDEPTAGPTTSSSAPTSTTAPPVPTFPLTGVPVDDPARAARPALVVKIDNAQPAGRPQAGVNQADVVYEEVVEGSVTRFAAVFQSTDADPVGPVRSGRSTDVAITVPLNRPLFAWSGSNPEHKALLEAAPLVDLEDTKFPAGYRRRGDRRAPHNLFSSTGLLYSRTPPDAGPPPALFAYRPPGEPAPADARGVGHVNITFGAGPGSAPVDYRWDAGIGGWRRDQEGTPHVDDAGAQVAPQNVVIQFTPYREVGCCITGFPVIEAELVGEGEVWVLTDGRLVQGRWSRPAPEAVTTYTDAAGAPIGLTPGRTWVALAPPGSATVVG